MRRENGEEREREGGAGETGRASSSNCANGRGTDGKKEGGRGMAGRRGEIGHKKLEEKLR